MVWKLGWTAKLLKLFITVEISLFLKVIQYVTYGTLQKEHDLSVFEDDFGAF